jgi:2-phosphosulfolactate phosphatase
VVFDQAEYDLRCEWGLPGVLALASISDVLIVVDVLSFSTAVDIAVANGASVLPYRWRDGTVKEFAAFKGAVLASPRSASDHYSLSPASLQAIPAHTALVLPSPNGGTLSLKSGAAVTFTACLRNCQAVAKRAQCHGARMAVVPAGEQWSDGSLRPAMEDLIGAGAVLRELPGKRSPEAELAVAVFERFRHDLHDAITGSASGRELVARGFIRDIELAAEYSSSSAVPVLQEDRFVDARLLPKPSNHISPT